MTRYIDLCAGQIRAELHDDGSVTWDGGNATRDEVMRYLIAKQVAIELSAEIIAKMVDWLSRWSEKERSK